MLYEYHVIYSVRYYPRFHVTSLGLGTYCPWIRRSACTRYSPYLDEVTQCILDTARVIKTSRMLISGELILRSSEMKFTI